MKRVGNHFLSRLVSRLDRVGPEELQNYLQQLVRERGFLETIFNTLQEGILVLDAKGKITYLNDSIQRLLGFGEEALGKEVGHYLRDTDWDWPRLLKERQVLNRELEVFYPEYRMLNFYHVPLAKKELGSALIFHDITATAEETQERIESERLKAITLLAAGVAHELGNPLNSLHIHFQLIERDLRKLKAKTEEGAVDPLLESVQVAQREIGRLDNIISQFLRALRPEGNERSAQQINDVVEESLNFLRPELDDRSILVEAELAKDLPPVEIDVTQLKQALYNLIKNSIQAMPSGGVLRVSTGRNDTHLLVSITDNGCGIDAETVARIFDPYFTTKQKGSGLGLFIVRRIIQQHGGELAIESEPGQGTTARIILPLTERRVRLLTAGDPGEDGPKLVDVEAEAIPVAAAVATAAEDEDDASLEPVLKPKASKRRARRKS